MNGVTDGAGQVPLPHPHHPKGAGGGRVSMAATSGLLYKRVLLKISGEALMGQREFCLDPETVSRVAHELKQDHALCFECCLVIDGAVHILGYATAANGMPPGSS